MEPKSLRSPSAQDAASLRAAVAGSAPEPAAKLSKPVADVSEFRSTSWTAVASPVAAPVEERPSRDRLPAAVPATRAPVDSDLGALRKDVADLRGMVAEMSETLRLLESRLAGLQGTPRRG